MGQILLISALLLMTFLTKGSLSQECGRAPLNPRIVGGEDASPGNWPWQTFLQFEDPDGNASICGGALINHQWILTAAHCLYESNPELTDIFLGSHNLSDPGPQEESRTVAKWEYHKSYNHATSAYDIGLIKMDSPVDYNDYIRPLCLAEKGSSFHTGVKAWVAGWGLLAENGSLPDVLQEVSVPIVGHKQCKCNNTVFVPDKTICAGYAEGGKDSCKGDSGGPLVVKNGDIWVEAGLVSFGDGCARPYLPGVYTEVSEFQDWIMSIVGKEDPPGFVKYTSSGEDSDKNFICSGSTAPIPTSAAAKITMIFLCLTTFLY